MLHGHRDDHRRELRALRLVDSYGVGQRDLVQFPVVVDNQPVVEPYRDFLLHGIDLLDHADVAVEDLLLLVVLRLDDFVPNLEPPSKSLRGGLTRTNRVQSALEHCVQLADSDRAPIHRAQDLYVTNGVEAMALGNSVLNQPPIGRTGFRAPWSTVFNSRTPIEPRFIGHRTCMSRMGSRRWPLGILS